MDPKAMPTSSNTLCTNEYYMNIDNTFIFNNNNNNKFGQRPYNYQQIRLIKGNANEKHDFLMENLVKRCQNHKQKNLLNCIILIAT